jgi:hypothetical protein
VPAVSWTPLPNAWCKSELGSETLCPRPRLAPRYVRASSSGLAQYLVAPLMADAVPGAATASPALAVDLTLIFDNRRPLTRLDLSQWEKVPEDRLPGTGWVLAGGMLPAAIMPARNLERDRRRSRSRWDRDKRDKFSGSPSSDPRRDNVDHDRKLVEPEEPSRQIEVRARASKNRGGLGGRKRRRAGDEGQLSDDENCDHCPLLRGSERAADTKRSIRCRSSWGRQST